VAQLHAAEGDAADAVATLKQEREHSLVIFGSGALVQSLMQRDLIDEYVLQIHPLVLGTGRRLFPDGSPHTPLRLTDTVPMQTGVLIATYRRYRTTDRPVTRPSTLP
jgi:dihydrofolate reductase